MFSIKVNDQYPFEFETVQVDEQGQVIERKQGRAFAFRELLADEIGLEMVAIPSGKFMMSAPESEYDRKEGGNPHHQVTLQPFFMGKYPVTEVQWQAIANIALQVGFSSQSHLTQYFKHLTGSIPKQVLKITRIW
jgi:formylglycine-generating enzyme required for sulfatase activity